MFRYNIPQKIKKTIFFTENLLISAARYEKVLDSGEKVLYI